MRRYRRSFKIRRAMPTKMRGFYRKAGYYGRYNRVNRRAKLGEIKFKDKLQGPTSVSQTGTVINDTILVIPEGVSEDERIGRKITLSSISFHGMCVIPTTATQAESQDTIRIVVYLDKQCNGAAATWANVFDGTDIDGFRNLANQHRFQILLDRQYTIFAPITSGTAAEATTLSQARHRRIAWHIPIKRQIFYNKDLTTGALSTIESNNIGMMAISQLGHVDIQGCHRVRYHE